MSNDQKSIVKNKKELNYFYSDDNIGTLVITSSLVCFEDNSTGESSLLDNLYFEVYSKAGDEIKDHSQSHRQ